MADTPLVIAHRGASGYLPEHTLPAAALAHAMGADFIEQDVVLSSDHQPLVLHDIHLDTVTDVARVYPDRARGDGRFYAIDFTLEEIRRLRATERIDHETGKRVYPGRFPAGQSRFTVPTLGEEIELIRGLNQTTGRNVGLYVEIKKPAWHRKQGADPSQVVLEVLRQYGYESRADNVYLQCFDPQEARRLREELGTELKIVQLIRKNDGEETDIDFDDVRTPAGLAEVAKYADGIGLPLDFVVAGRDRVGNMSFTNLVSDAHRHKLVVHAFTLRADDLPNYADDFAKLLGIVKDADVDGFFTDFPDQAVAYLKQ